MTQCNVFILGVVYPALVAGLMACGVPPREPTPSTGIERVWREELSVVAQERLNCERQHLQYDYLGDRVHRMRGCGREVRYLIFPFGDLWVKIESFHERAAYELDCGIDEIVVERESRAIWKADGCGSSVTYDLQCQADGVTCRWGRSDGGVGD